MPFSPSCQGATCYDTGTNLGSRACAYTAPSAPGSKPQQPQCQNPKSSDQKVLAHHKPSMHTPTHPALNYTAVTVGTTTTTKTDTASGSKPMPRAKRICSKPGCPSPSNGGLCTTHAREADRARGTREQRGYGPEHQALRRQWAHKVKAGTVRCAKCNQPIKPGTPWHLGHTDDRTKWTGPEHPFCNTSDAGKRSHLRPT